VSDKLEFAQLPVVDVGMRIRRPQAEVFAAMTDPAITTRFWFTKSSGPLRPGARVRWEWEMYGVGADVSVRELEAERRIVFDWGPEGSATTVEFRFTPTQDDSTYVQVTEHGHPGSADDVVARVIDSTGGFTMMLCALKALLEHGVVLTVVADKAPPEELRAPAR
jgi:uncharacterized protein YndB with AHSA1/START domain